VREMTNKPPSGLAASGHADDSDPDITKEHNEDGRDINIDPSDDVTVEATEDVTTEAASYTPAPSLRPTAADGTPAPRLPTLLGVPIQSLPLPGVTASSPQGDATRTIDYDDEITVLAQPSPSTASVEFDDGDSLGPSIVDDDEEETKVEPAESAMKAAESIDDVTTALSAQASLEREKALRRVAPAPAFGGGDDLEFADPEADENEEEQEESLDDELSDEDEVISAGGAGAVEEEEDVDDADDDAHDGVATATFMKPADSTGLSGLLNPRRPPTGGRDGFGSRLPTPYSAAASSASASTVPAPSTSPFASRLGPAPSGSPYGARATGSPMPAIQVPPPSGAATTASGPSFFSKQVPMGGVILISLGAALLGFGVRGLGGKSAQPSPTTIVAKPTAAPAPAAPVVEPVVANPGTAPAETKPPTTPPPIEAVKAPPASEAQGLAQAGSDPAAVGADTVKPAVKKTPKPHKPAVETASEDATLKPAATSKPPATPKPAVATAPKPAAAPKAAAKKPAKVWVDPFAQ